MNCLVSQPHANRRDRRTTRPKRRSPDEHVWMGKRPELPEGAFLFGAGKAPEPTTTSGGSKPGQNKKTLPGGSVFFGAGKGIRTPDFNLGKVTLYH